MCCEGCDRAYRWTYELCGDGDGIEFLVETAHLIDGGRATSTVVFSALGVQEATLTALTEIPQFCSPKFPTSGRFRA